MSTQTPDEPLDRDPQRDPDDPDQVNEPDEPEDPERQPDE
jgi:hypothetical protein